MMDGMMPGMMLGLLGLLVVIALVLSAAALISNTCAPEMRGTDYEQIGDHRTGNLRILVFRSRRGRRIPRPAGFPDLRAVPLARARPEHDGDKFGRPLGTQGRGTIKLRPLLRCAEIFRHYLGRPRARW